MARVCILIAPGFEEIEAITIIDVLRRAEVDLKTVAVEKGPVKGSHNVVVQTDLDLDKALGEKWDMVILPGGLPGSTNLRDSAKVRKLIQAQAAEGRKIGAICAAPIALGAAGLLKGKRATSYPGFEKELTGATYVSEPVVRDGNIITSRGPGTAMEFSLQIVADLKGKETAEALRKGMLVAA